MGLLDKVDNLEEVKPVKKAVAKKAVAKKAVARKTTPERPVAKAAKTTTQEAKLRPTGLPEGFELAGGMPRYISWLINFAVNFGLLIMGVSMNITSSGGGGPGASTWILAGAIAAILVNTMVMPVWTGRNFGEFTSRTKYINVYGNRPLFLHPIFNNLLGFLSLIGFFFVFTSMSELSDSQKEVTYFVIGIILMVIWVVNFFFKKNSDYSQGLFDMMFKCYLVKHVATGEETGWFARFEALGDFGDKYTEKSAARETKRAERAEEKINKAKQAKAEIDSEDQSKD